MKNQFYRSRKRSNDIDNNLSSRKVMILNRPKFTFKNELSFGSPDSNASIVLKGKKAPASYRNSISRNERRAKNNTFLPHSYITSSDKLVMKWKDYLKHIESSKAKKLNKTSNYFYKFKVSKKDINL